MRAYIFPGQGSQFSGMGKQLFDSGNKAKQLFETANEVIGFRISDIMFNGSEEELKQTRVTQPAVFIHSVIQHKIGATVAADMVAGHSLGEFSALVANGTLEFEDALRLVTERAEAMQAACELQPSTMAAIIGLADEKVEEICRQVDEVVVPANYNCPGQLVISGSVNGVNQACGLLKAAGARRALILNVGGAFHSPLMEPARVRLEKALLQTNFRSPVCPVIQNVTAKAETDPETIRMNLIAQLTAPVRWTQSVMTMVQTGATEFIESGPGNVLQGLVKKISASSITGTLAM
jgi:[acyl-carrier-protein] S-malonyltransferase